MNFVVTEFFRFFDCMIAVYREAIAAKNKNAQNKIVDEDAENADSDNKVNDATIGAAADVDGNLTAAEGVAILIPGPVTERLTASGTALIENRKEVSDWPPRICLEEGGGGGGRDTEREPIDVAVELVKEEKSRSFEGKLKKIAEVEILHRIHTFDLTGMRDTVG